MIKLGATLIPPLITNKINLWDVIGASALPLERSIRQYMGYEQTEFIVQTCSRLPRLYVRLVSNSIRGFILD